MAKKRMFSMDIIDTDRFMDMPCSAQNLYFHLGMHGDDDGFVSSPRRIMRAIGSADDDLKLLITKGFIIPFESGIVVIADWRTNNNLRNDRYHQTNFQAEKRMLSIEESTGKYTLLADNLYPECVTYGIPNDNQKDTSGIPSIAKHSITKQNKDIGGSRGEQRKKFAPPTLEEVKAYAEQRHSCVDPNMFFEYFDAGGWVDSRGNPVRNWKQKFLTWERAQPQISPQVATAREEDYIKHF